MRIFVSTLAEALDGSEPVSQRGSSSRTLASCSRGASGGPGEPPPPMTLCWPRPPSATGPPRRAGQRGSGGSLPTFGGPHQPASPRAARPGSPRNRRRGGGWRLPRPPEPRSRAPATPPPDPGPRAASPPTNAGRHRGGGGGGDWRRALGRLGPRRGSRQDHPQQPLDVGVAVRASDEMGKEGQQGQDTAPPAGAGPTRLQTCLRATLPHFQRDSLVCRLSLYFALNS